MAEPMRTISVKVPADLDRVLSDLARWRNVSRSVVLRDALRAFARRRATSVSAQAGDLAGSVRGPRDLSTGTRHLDGYGR